MYASQQKQIRNSALFLLCIFVVICIGLFFQCFNENPVDSLPTDLEIKVTSPTGVSRDSRTFFVGENIQVCIQVLEVEPIDSIVFGSISNTAGTITKDVIKPVDTVLHRGEINFKNYLTVSLDHPGTFLLGAYAQSKYATVIDTVSVTIIEQDGKNQAPVVHVKQSRPYAATSLPCSLRVSFSNHESWQTVKLLKDSMDQDITCIGDSLCIWTPTVSDTSKTHSLRIIAYDNGSPRGIDDTTVIVKVIPANQQPNTPQGLRVAERSVNVVKLVWNLDSLVDGYTVLRSRPGASSIWDTIGKTKLPEYVDSTDTIFIYRVVANNFFGKTASVTDIVGRDTVHYAHTIGFEKAQTSVSENDSVCVLKVQVSQTAKMPITIWLHANGINADTGDYRLQTPSVVCDKGNTFAEIRLRIINDDSVEQPESLTITIDSVSSGYLSGMLLQKVVIADNDTLYKVSYDANGADGGAVPKDSGSYKRGAKVTVKNNTGILKRNGYTFTEWNTSADGKGETYEAGALLTITTGNVVLYARWTAETGTLPDTLYSVTYDGNGATGGTVPKDTTKYKSGASVIVLGNTAGLVKTGNTFTGWNIRPDGKDTAYVAGKVLIIKRENVTLYAQWTINRFTVKFDCRGGSPVDSQNVNYGDTAKTPIPPNKTGYAFVGWCKDSLCVNAWEFAKDSVINSVTLYAKWKIKQYKVTYDGNVNTGGSIPVDSVYYDSGSTAKVSENKGYLVKDGYTFIGWNTNADGSGASYNAGSTIIMQSSITLYAKWAAKVTYTLTYNGNGNTSGTVPGTVTCDSICKITVAKVGTLEKTNYTFTCWNTLPDGTGTDFAPDSIFVMPLANDTLFAKWMINQYTITFDTREGSAIASQKVNYGSYVISPTLPLKTGNRFDGWYKEPECINIWNFKTDVVTTDRTLYGKWTPVYIVTYYGNEQTDGTPPVDLNTYSNSQVVTILDNTGSLTRTGYAFGGWNTNPTGTGTDRLPGGTFSMGSVNVQLYAKWMPVYSIVFDGQGATTPANPTIKTVTYPATTIIALPAPPTKSGYIFGGWYSGTDGSGTEFTTSSVVNSNDTVYAKWTVFSYTITFDDQGATAPVNPATRIVTPPATTVGTLPVQPTKTGYTFGGWFTSLNGGGTEFTASSVVTVSDTVFARWHSTIYFDDQNATTPANPTTKIVIPPATSVGSLPLQPTRTGYTFGGWFTSVNGGGTELNGTTAVVISDTVFAKWTVNTYNVTFDKNDSVAGGTMNPQPIAFGSSANLATCGFTKAGYRFAGWATSAGGSVVFGEQASYTMLTEGASLFAKWQPIPYTITYHLNGGTNGNNPDSYTIESPAITFANAVKRSYVFDGWFSDTGLSAKVTSIPAGSTGNRELWAKWVIKDIDGNIYTEVTIGSQVWMVENLRVTRYNDSTSIRLVTGSWNNLLTDGYCFYNNSNDTVQQRKWGALYNAYAVTTGKLAPVGWHVPSDAEWTNLENFLITNGYNFDSSTTGNYIAKSLATRTDWTTSNIRGAIGSDLTKNNRSGFSALPGGYRLFDLGDFVEQGIGTEWWSSTGDGEQYQWSRYLGFDMSSLTRFSDSKIYGVSVRCIRD